MLHEDLGTDILPAEYGGTNGTVQELTGERVNRQNKFLRHGCSVEPSCSQVALAFSSAALLLGSGTNNKESINGHCNLHQGCLKCNYFTCDFSF